MRGINKNVHALAFRFFTLAFSEIWWFTFGNVEVTPNTWLLSLLGFVFSFIWQLLSVVFVLKWCNPWRVMQWKILWSFRLHCVKHSKIFQISVVELENVSLFQKRYIWHSFQVKTGQCNKTFLFRKRGLFSNVFSLPDFSCFCLLNYSTCFCHSG